MLLPPTPPEEPPRDMLWRLWLPRLLKSLAEEPLSIPEKALDLPLSRWETPAPRSVLPVPRLLSIWLAPARRSAPRLLSF